jgi:hypothetical protein
MPLFNTFTGGSARALGNISAEPPGKPVLTVTASAVYLTIDFTFSNGAFPINAIEYRYRVTAGTWGNWIVLSPSLQTVTISGLTPNTSYDYEFRVKDQANQYGLTTAGTTSTPNETAPSAVSSLTVNPTGTSQLTVSFGPSTAGTYPITKYQYRVGSGSFIDTPVTANTPFNITSLNPETSYTISVRAYASSGTTSSASSASATTDPTIAAAPTISWSRMTTSDRTTAKLSWNNVATSSTGTLTYYVYSYEVNDSEQVVAQLATQSTSGTTADVSVAEGKNYRFYIYANNRLNQNNGPSYRGALTTGRSNVTWSTISGIAEVHLGRQRSTTGTAGAIVINFPTVPAGTSDAGYIYVQSASVYIRRATNAGDAPLTSGTFGHTDGLKFVLMDAADGGGNELATWVLPTNVGTGFFNVTNQYIAAGFESPFITNINYGGGSISGRSMKVTATGDNATKFSQVQTNGVFANPSNNLLGTSFALTGYQNTGSIYN